MLLRRFVHSRGPAALVAAFVLHLPLAASVDLQEPAPAAPTAPRTDATRPQQPEASKPAAPDNGSPKVPMLDSVVIDAEDGRVPLRYPGGRDVVDQRTMRTYPGGSFDTVLRRTPGVYYLPENGNDSRISIGLRGNDPRRSALTTLLVDGIPICEAPYGNTDVDGLPIAFDRVWRTDVIRGSGSIRYGPNAAGGIVNLLTEPVPDRTMLRVTGRYGSDDAYSGSTAVGGTWDGFGVLATGVTKGGDGFRDNSEYEDNDGSLKLRYALNGKETLSAYVSRFTELHAEQPGGLTQAAYDADPNQSLRPGADFNFDMNRYVVQYTNQIDRDTTFEAKVWHQVGTRELNDFRPIVPPFTVTRQQNSDFESSAFELAYSWRTTMLGLEHRVHHSARYLMEVNDELYVRTPIGGGAPITPLELNAKFRGRVFSFFTEDVITLVRDLEWGIGFRAESIVMSGDSKTDGNQIVRNYSEVLPTTNLTWTFLPRTAAYASYQKGFYPPQYETGFDPASVLFAPTTPEHSDAYELGMRTRGIDGIDAAVALFDTEFRDKIDFLNTPNGKVAVNSGEAHAYGVEGSVAYELGAASASLEGLSVYGTILCQRSKIQEGANRGKDTPNAPRVITSWGAMYEHERSGLWIRFGGSHTGGAFKDLANTPVGSADGLNGPEPSYTLWDVALGWWQHPDHDGLAATIGVTNLFDEDYFRRFATGIYPGAPREEFLEISYTLHL